MGAPVKPHTGIRVSTLVLTGVAVLVLAWLVMRWVEGNLPTGHRTSVRTGLPQGTWRQLNYGVQPTKSTTSQVTDACGMLETYSEIDKALADLNGNTAEFRLSEDKAFLEGLSQQMAQTIFYGNTATTPENILTYAAVYACVPGLSMWSAIASRADRAKRPRSAAKRSQVWSATRERRL